MRTIRILLIGVMMIINHHSLNAQTEVITIKEAITILNEIGVVMSKKISEPDHVYFKSEETVKNIINKYGYSLTKDCFEVRIDNYPYVYYKNCNLSKEGLPKPKQRKSASMVTINEGLQVGIIIFSQELFNKLISQLKDEGFKTQKDEWGDIRYIKDNYTIMTTIFNGEYRIKIWKQI